MLLQRRGDGPDLSWIFQLVAVFVFLVLPVLRSIAEARKKGRAGQPGRPPPPARTPGQRSGRDQWRDLLEGREPGAPPPRAPKPVRSPPVAAPAPVPRPLPLPVPAAPAPALAPLAESAALAASFTPAASELGAREIDPATLDDELAARWGERGPAGARSPLAAALLSGLDWRGAVLVSEVLAPPLALRGRSAAWPGPPACLGA